MILWLLKIFLNLLTEYCFILAFCPPSIQPQSWRKNGKWHCSGRKSRLWSMITKCIVKWKITMIKVITISFLPPTFCHPLHYKWNVGNLKPRGSVRLTEKWNSTVSFHEVVFYYRVEHLPCCIYFGITHNLVENSSLILCKNHNNFIGSSSCISLESLCLLLAVLYS